MLISLGGTIANAARAAVKAAESRVGEFAKQVSQAHLKSNTGTANHGGSGLAVVAAVWRPAVLNTSEPAPQFYQIPASGTFMGPTFFYARADTPGANPVPAPPTFDSLNDPVSNALKALLGKIRADPTTDPAAQKANQVAQAALESLLWAKEAERLQKIADDKKKITDKAEKDYGTGSIQHLTALADQRAAEAAVGEAVAKANEAAAQLRVYAADPAYKQAVATAQAKINDALEPLGLEFTIPKAQGTLAQAQAQLVARKTATQLATNAKHEYELALAAFSQVPITFDPDKKPVAGASIDVPGSEAENTRNARTASQYATDNRLYTDGMLHLAQGDKYTTDFNVETLKADLALTKPGSPENKQIQAALTVALGEQTAAGERLTVIKAYWTLADATAMQMQFLLQKELLTNRALAALRQRMPYLFNQEGFYDGNHDYSGELISVTTAIDPKDGQLYVTFKYEHKTIKLQLTFAPGKRNKPKGDETQIDQDWAQMMKVDPKYCDNNMLNHVNQEVARAERGVTNLNLGAANQNITQLQKTYDDLIAATAAHAPGDPLRPQEGEVKAAKTALDLAIGKRDALLANMSYLNFLVTVDLTNLDEPEEERKLRGQYFASNEDERQRQFKDLQLDWGKPVTLQGRDQIDNTVTDALSLPSNKVKPVTDKILEVGGANVTVQVAPVFLVMKDGGFYQSTVFVVQGSDGVQHIVDENGRDYDDIEDYREHNQLPGAGTLYAPQDLKFTQDAAGKVRIAQLDIEGDPLDRADGAVAVVATLSTIASFTPLAPVAVPIAVASGTYLGLRAGEHLVDRYQHGEDMMTWATVMDVAMIATSVLPVASGLLRMSALLREGMTLTAASRTGFGAINFASPTFGAKYMTKYAPDVAVLTAERGAFMRDGGLVYRTASKLDHGALYVGAPLLIGTGYDLAAHSDQMSDLDQMNSVLGLVSGIYGSGLGLRGIIHDRRMAEAARLRKANIEAGQKPDSLVPMKGTTTLPQAFKVVLIDGVDGGPPTAHIIPVAAQTTTVAGNNAHTITTGAHNGVSGKPPARALPASLKTPFPLEIILGAPHENPDVVVTDDQRHQFRNLVAELNGRFLSDVLGARRFMVRSAANATHIVASDVLNQDLATYLPEGAHVDDIMAFVAYKDGKAQGIFFRDTLAARPIEEQQQVVAHDTAHFYLHPDFVKLAMPLRVNANDPHSNLVEGMAEFIGQRFLKGPGEDIVGVHNPAETKVISAIAAELGGAKLISAAIAGNGRALKAFHAAALRIQNVVEVKDASPASTGDLPGFARPPGAVQIPGSGFRGEEWAHFYSDLRAGNLPSATTRYVYVVSGAQPDKAISFNTSDVQFYGTIPKNGKHIQWRGNAPANVNGTTVTDIFGLPSSSAVHFVITDRNPSQVLKSATPFEVTRGLPHGKQIQEGLAYKAGDWIPFYKNVTNDKIGYLGERNIYVVEVSAGDPVHVTFNPADLRAVGRLQRGANGITWISTSSNVSNPITITAAGKTSKAVFGTPPAGKAYRFFVSQLHADAIVNATEPTIVMLADRVPSTPARPATRASLGVLKLPSTTFDNPHRHVPPAGEAKFVKKIDKAAAKEIGLDDLVKMLYSGTMPTIEPSPLIVRITDVIQYNNLIEALAHQGHEHPEGYDARFTPDDGYPGFFRRKTRPLEIYFDAKRGKWQTGLWEYNHATSHPILGRVPVAGRHLPIASGSTRLVTDRYLQVRGRTSGIPYTMRMALVRGPYSEVWIAGIPQGCGVPHYTGIDSRAPDYTGAGVLDLRHLQDYQVALHNYSKWVEYMGRAAKDADPATASKIDELTLLRKDEELRTFLATTTLDATLQRQILRLATTDKLRPHLALNMHIALTGFNPASKESAGYLIDRFVEYYQLVGGMGEVTFLKENISEQQLEQAFDFNNADHRINAMTWLTVGKLFNKHTLAHSDNHVATVGTVDGRVQKGANPYAARSLFIKLISPFLGGSDGGITHAHMGGGRDASFNAAPITDRAKLASLREINGLTYGDEISTHFYELELTAIAHPELLSDNSWNDNSYAINTSEKLLRDYEIFQRRHPGLIVKGSDSVKPVNISQARQHGTDDLPAMVKLGINDKEALWSQIRGNFEKTVHGGKIETADLQRIANQLDELAVRIENPTGTTPIADPAYETIAQAFIAEAAAAGATMTGPAATAAIGAKATEIATTLRDLATKLRGAPPPKEYPVMDTVWKGGTFTDPATGHVTTIVRGRAQMRDMAAVEFGKIDFESARGKVENWPEIEPISYPPQTGDLPAEWAPKKPIVHDTSYTAQEGTPAGYARMPLSPKERVAEIAAELTPIAIGLALGAIHLPPVGDVASLFRQAFFRGNVNAPETLRLRWENIHEEAQVTDNALSVYLAEVVKVGYQSGVDAGDLKLLVLTLAQLRSDVAYIREVTKTWPAARKTEVFDMLMAAVGNAQFTGDAQTGVQAASLSKTNIRTKGARVKLAAINTTAAATMGSSVWATYMVMQNPAYAQHLALLSSLSGVQTAMTVGALSLMIARNVAASTRGRRLKNPELAPGFSKMQHNILRLIKYSGASGVALNTAIMMATSDHGHWVEPAVKTLVGVGTYAAARRVKNIEKLKNKNKGSFLPAIAAHSTKRTLLWLEIGAAISIIAYGIDASIAFVAKQNAEDKVDSTQQILTTAEADLAKAQDLVKQKHDILKPLEQKLKDAQDALDKAKTANDQAAIDAAQKDVDKAEQDCKQPRDDLARAEKASDYAQTAFNEAKKQRKLAGDDLATKNAALDALFPFA